MSEASAELIADCVELIADCVKLIADCGLAVAVVAIGSGAGSSFWLSCDEEKEESARATPTEDWLSCDEESSEGGASRQ